MQKIFHSFIFPLLMCFMTQVFTTGCSEEDEYIDIENQPSELMQLYISNNNIDTTSMFLLLNTNSRTAVDNKYPVFTSEDLEYLSSLTQEEFQDIIDCFNSQLNTNERIEVENIQDSVYIETFTILGGHENMNKLISFTQKYMESAQGWDTIESLLPDNLSYKQGEIYIQMAVYTDKIARPIYEELNGYDLSKDQTSLNNNDIEICKWYLTQRLAIAGIGISAEAFIDSMTGGVATPIEAIATGADLLGIWLDYEVCNHRWH